jgi:hypothetical protein
MHFPRLSVQDTTTTERLIYDVRVVLIFQEGMR